jgi:AMP deaminase
MVNLLRDFDPAVCSELTLNLLFLDQSASGPNSGPPTIGSHGEPQDKPHVPTSPSTPSTLLARSPHVAAGEFPSPGNGALGTGVGGADGLPEQKIFPGIVHERARKGNMHQ